MAGDQHVLIPKRQNPWCTAINCRSFKHMVIIVKRCTKTRWLGFENKIMVCFKHLSTTSVTWQTWHTTLRSWNNSRGHTGWFHSEHKQHLLGQSLVYVWPIHPPRPQLTSFLAPVISTTIKINMDRNSLLVQPNYMVVIWRSFSTSQKWKIKQQLVSIFEIFTDLQKLLHNKSHLLTGVFGYTQLCNSKRIHLTLGWTVTNLVAQ